jgi:hypothetical protein
MYLHRVFANDCRTCGRHVDVTCLRVLTLADGSDGQLAMRATSGPRDQRDDGEFVIGNQRSIVAENSQVSSDQPPGPICTHHSSQ